ncbi:50S ribosomal protein L22 [Patescibacteria group bacterium]|nr:50S ribosomal protein L22 [Patescibacteria group bacterium]
MMVQAKAKFIRISPRKVRLVIDIIRGLKVAEAKAQLTLSPKAASVVVLKVLDSAIANAVNNNGLKAEDLVVESAFVDEGPTLKRFSPRAHGRATTIRKRMSHITVCVSDGKAENIEIKKEVEEVKAEKEEKKSTSKKTESSK